MILQAMGLADDVQVAIGRLHLRRADTLLICCDGLSNTITDDEIRQILTANDPTSACARLIDLANDRGGTDNLTAIVARLDGRGLQSASADELMTATFDVLRAFTTEASKPVAAPSRAAAGRGRPASTSTPNTMLSPSGQANAPRSVRRLQGMIVLALAGVTLLLLAVYSLVGPL
jgi:protein phosphatase